MNYYARSKIRERVYNNILNEHNNYNILNLHYGNVVCKCPKCNGDIIEHQTNYECAKCGMKIKKEIGGKYIKQSMIIELCTKKELQYIHNNKKYKMYFNENFNIVLKSV